MTQDDFPGTKPPKPKRKIGSGAPKYTDALGREICGRIADGQTLRQIGALPDMPHQATIRSWLTQDQMETFRERYERARKAQADALVDELLADATDATPENAHAQRVKIDAKKWAASKMNPAAYGERLDVNVSGRVDHVHMAKEAPEWLQERLKDHPKTIEHEPAQARVAAPQPKPDGTTTH